jgi:DNA-binding beta-propeller fold protein YncE
MEVRMRLSLLATCGLLALVGCSKPAPSAAQEPTPAAAPVRVVGHTDLPGYTGDFDHFAVDEPDNRLFLAGEDGGVIEVFDLKTGALIKTVPGFDAPHSLIYLPETGELVVIANQKSRVLNARTLAETRSLDLAAGADSMGYDAPRKRAYVVTGGKDVGMKTTALVEIDPYTGKIYGETPFDGDHTEALAVEQSGDRIFINQTDKNLLDVVDKNTHQIKASWKIKEAEQNAPVAYDEKTHRLFVVTRKPGKLIVVNADTGATVQVFDAPSRVDQAIWDPASRRIFVCGGDGHLAVFEQDDADHYRALPPVATPPASKTGVYAPSLNRLYLAASPGDSKTMAQLVVLDVDPRR